MDTPQTNELLKDWQWKKPADERVMADVVEVSGASFPNDLLEFMRLSNGAYRETPCVQLNAVDDWMCDSSAYTAPRKVWMIANDGADGAYCWDERGKEKGFTHTSLDGFKVWERMGSTFAAFLEKVEERASQTPEEKSQWKNWLAKLPRVKEDEQQTEDKKITPAAKIEALAQAAVVASQQPGKPSRLEKAAEPLLAEGAKLPAFFKKEPGVVMRLRCGDIPPWLRLALSPDARLAATTHAPNGYHDAENSLAKIWDLATGKVVKERAFKGSVEAMCWSPDSARVFALRYWQRSEFPGGPPLETELVVEDLVSGERLFSTQDLREAGSLCLPRPGWDKHPEGLVAVNGCREITQGVYQNYLSLRDMGTGQVLLNAPCGRGGVMLSANGRRLVLGWGAEGYAESYDVETGKRLAFFEPMSKDVGAMAVSPEGTYVATGGGGWSSRPSVAVMNVETGKTVHEFKALNMRVPLAVAFMDEDRLVVTTKTGTLHVVSVQQKKEISRFEFPKNGYYGHISVAGDFVLAGTAEAKTLMLYRV